MKKFNNFINNKENQKIEKHYSNIDETLDIIQNSLSVIDQQTKKWKKASLGGGYHYNRLAELFTSDKTSTYIKKGILELLNKENTMDIETWLNDPSYWKKANVNIAKETIKKLQSKN